jgi:hypothetical protein
MKWAISLEIRSDETVEEKAGKILKFILRPNEELKFHITEIDATGKTGNLLTQRANKQAMIELTTNEVMELLSENGQIFDLDLTITGSTVSRLIISDGNYIDIIGSGQMLPESLTGPFKLLNAEMYE